MQKQSFRKVLGILGILGILVWKILEKYKRWNWSTESAEFVFNSITDQNGAVQLDIKDSEMVNKKKKSWTYTQQT